MTSLLARLNELAERVLLPLTVGGLALGLVANAAGQETAAWWLWTVPSAIVGAWLLGNIIADLVRREAAQRSEPSPNRCSALSRISATKYWARCVCRPTAAGARCPGASRRPIRHPWSRRGMRRPGARCARKGSTYSRFVARRSRGY